MRSERREERHRHVALVATAPDVAPLIPERTETARLQAGGVSLLRLSVPARLLMVAAAAALLWGAVFWALA
jgi:hypothetical protein